MKNELAALLRDAAILLAEYATEAGEVYPKVGHKLEAAADELVRVEPVACIRKNAAGQISMMRPDGDYFDMSKYVGCDVYTTPPAPQVPDDTGLEAAILVLNDHDMYEEADKLRARAAPQSGEGE